MLYNMPVARGSSGRIVLEIEPDIKEDLYRALEKEGLTLKEWFLKNTSSFLTMQGQMQLFSATAESPSQYRSKARKTKKKK